MQIKELDYCWSLEDGETEGVCAIEATRFWAGEVQ
jgi:hypothetical protein